MAAVIGFSFKERFLRFQLLFPDFYHFHHVIWRMNWAKKLKPNTGQNMTSGPFSHDVAHLLLCSISARAQNASLLRYENTVDAHARVPFSARDEKNGRAKILARFEDTGLGFLAWAGLRPGLNPSPCNRQFDFKRFCFRNRAEISARDEIRHVIRP